MLINAFSNQGKAATVIFWETFPWKGEKRDAYQQKIIPENIGNCGYGKRTGGESEARQSPCRNI